MKRFFFPLLLSLYGLCCLASPVKSQVLEFYQAYMKNALANNNAANEQLCNKFFTKAMKLKIERMSDSIDADPIIRAQDVSTDGLESLKVENVAPNWYMVSYVFDKTKPNNVTKIPLKAVENGGKCSIVYIVSPSYEEQYGDKLLEYDKVPQVISKDCSGTEFLRSFYLNYMSQYASMSDNLSGNLSALRDKYLSDEARKEFKSALVNDADEGYAHYDLLLDNYDIDAMALKTLSVKPLDNNVYEVSYKFGKDLSKTIKVGLVQQKGSFIINSILVSDNRTN